MTKVVLPLLAEGVAKAAVSYIYAKVGDTVKEGDSLIEFVTDKATFNMPSPAAGRISQVLVKEGDEVAIGGDLLYLE